MPSEKVVAAWSLVVFAVGFVLFTYGWLLPRGWKIWSRHPGRRAKGARIDADVRKVPPKASGPDMASRGSQMDRGAAQGYSGGAAGHDEDPCRGCRHLAACRFSEPAPTREEDQ